MPQFRNVSGETLWIDLASGRLEKVGAGDVVTISDAFLTDHYIQTGETGETPMWESVGAGKKSTTTTTPAAPAPAENKE